MVTLVAEVQGQESQKEKVATVVNKIEVLKVQKEENVIKAHVAEDELKVVKKIKERQEFELQALKDDLELNSVSLSEVGDTCKGVVTHLIMKRWRPGLFFRINSPVL